jgi:hypothetical protein
MADTSALRVEVRGWPDAGKATAVMICSDGKNYELADVAPSPCDGCVELRLLNLQPLRLRQRACTAHIKS